MTGDSSRVLLRSNLTTKLVGGYLWVFGTVGLLTVGELGMHLLARLPDSERLKAVGLLALMASVFGGVTAVGLGLIRWHPRAWLGAVVVQLAQIPTWHVSGSAFTFVAGALVGVARTPDGLVPLVGLKSSVFIGWDSRVETPFIGANLAPIVVLVLVLLTSRGRLGHGAGERSRAEATD